MTSRFEIPEGALLYERIETLISEFEWERLPRKDLPEAILVLVILHLTENDPCGSPSSSS